MHMVQITFSPTGGTQKIADIISAEWGKTGRKINLTNPETDYSAFRSQKDELALIAVPSYGGRVPALAAQRLSKIQGNGVNCILVCVYGNRAYEDTLIELYDLAGKCGFHVIAAISAVAEHSIMHQYAAGRPDQKDQNELRSFAKRISDKISQNEKSAVSLTIPGNRPYREFGGVGLVPKAGRKCINCGLCAKVCPAQAIDKANIKMADRKKCISCMRCVVECPKSIRKINGVVASIAALKMKKVCSERKRNELFIK